MKIDVVFSGGGVKAYAFLGALNSIEQNEHSIERVAGTSAGAIIASLLAAGYEAEELYHLLDELSLDTLTDPPELTKWFPFTKWLFLYFQMGLNKGNALENWLYEKLAQKNVYTFKDIQPGYLKIIASDLTLGKIVVIPDDLEEFYQIDPHQFPISTAVRMSAGFPYFFMPKKIRKRNIIVDGGLLSNFPLWVFESEGTRNRRPILGIKLTSTNKANPNHKINNALDMFQALFSTMKEAHDSRYVSKSNTKNIIFIPVDPIMAVDFSIEREEKAKLVYAGKKSANHFLSSWPN